MVLAFLLAMVLAYTGGFRHGDVMIDGPGVSMMLRILLGHWRHGNGIPAWLPDVWSGTPIWDLVGSFHLAVLLPLAGLVGPDQAVKLGILGAQVAGAWGSFVLARSLWGRTWPAVAAGLLYGLHPYFASSGPLSGHETSVWVFAATPWLAWSLRKALRREGLQYIGISGLLVAFALLQQAEHAYGLVLFCGSLLAVEFFRARRAGVGPLSQAAVLARAGAVVLIGTGLVAHWLFPFLARSKSFVLTPPEDVRVALDLIAGALGRRPQAFVSRATPMSGTYDFEKLGSQLLRMDGAAASAFYLGLVCLAMTVFTVLWLARHDDDDEGTLSAILFVSALGIWMSTGTVSIATGGLATPWGAPVLAVLGLAVGLLGGNLLRRFHLGRASQAAATGAAILAFTLPFVTPITAVQRLIPFLGDIRFPRLYPLAGLGVALGAAFPLTLVERWAARRPNRSRYLGPAAAIVLMAAFLVDVAPYRSLYRLRLPNSAAAYQDVAGTFSSLGASYRMIPADDGDPEAVGALLRAGARVSGGWPHPLASPALWKLTREAIEGSPVGYRNAALGLSSTAYIASQVLTDIGNGSREISRVQLEPVPNALPIVRAYERVALVDDENVAPELSAALAGRGVGVVTGSAGAARAVAALAPSTISGPDACAPAGAPRPDLGLLRGELAMACGLEPWVGVRQDRMLLRLEPTGAVFGSPVDGLRGVAVWLVGTLGPTELALRQVGADGVTLGPEILRARPDGVDETGMTRFGFDPIPDSAGKTYAFTVSCTTCAGPDAPQMVAITKPRGRGGLVIGDRLRPHEVAAFAPLYERMPAADPPATELAATQIGPGRWSIEADGPRPALVVVGESHFPGWEARVDGNRVPVLTADGGFLGVAVGAGPHHVTLEYHRPSAATAGRVVTAATLLICLVLVCPPLRRRLTALTAWGRPRR